METDPAPDERADQLASRQHGAISLAQAIEAGLTHEQVRERIRSRRWLRPARATFVVAGAPDTWFQAAMVACLAGPTGTVASHLTAAALHSLWTPPPVPHVTVPRAASGRFRSAIVHHSTLAPEDIANVDAIPCTTPARLVVDSATMLRAEQLCEMVDDVLCRPLTNLDVLRQAMARASQAPGRKGLRNLETALEVWTPGPAPGSPAEVRLIRWLLARGFPMPERQWEIRDHHGRFVARVDLAWPGVRAAVEYDGTRHHGPRRWEADARRQARIEALGWEVGRATKHDLGRPSADVWRWLSARLGLRKAA